MVMEPKNLIFRHIDGTDIINNKANLTGLILDNLMINFPGFPSLSDYAADTYEDIKRFQKDNSAILIGAFDKDMLIGFLWAYKRNVFGKQRIHLSHIVINSEFRSHGIGSKLLHTLEDLAKSEGIKKIELLTTLQNTNTVEFYKAKGYQMTRVQFEKELVATDDH